MDYKQPELVREVRRRIADGVYAGTLPTARAMAAEFGVNVKTLNKALAQLVAEGLIERKRRIGTRVRGEASGNGAGRDGRLVEVVFEGFATIFTHPFWGEIWSGLVTGLAQAGFRPVLTLLETDPESGLLRLDGFAPMPSAGRVVLGIAEKALLERVRTGRVPCVAACEPVEEFDIPQIAFDFTDGLDQAVAYLVARGCRDIGFVGQTQTVSDRGALHKFDAYRRAMERHARPAPQLAENARPLMGGGAAALETLCRRRRPDALVAAYDHQTPELTTWLRDHGMDIPVVGCDGLPLPELPVDRPVVAAPRRQCGERLAMTLAEAVRTRRRPRSRRLAAEFHEHGLPPP